MPAETITAATIVASGLTRRFGEHVALHPLDLQVGPGGITGLLGPNGSGKSTLMRCLVGLVRPDAGQITVAGQALVGDGTAIRKRVAYAPGELHLYGELSGDEHLRWFLRGRPRAALKRAKALAADMQIPLERHVRGYSHGMKRQLAFAAAMAPDVPVRILDELTEGLDPSKRSQVLEVLRADVERGTTILLSSHHLGEVDAACDRLVFMNSGRCIADESAAEVSSRAARLARVDYASAEQAASVRSALEAHGLEQAGLAELRSVDTRLVAMLASADPRPFLQALGALVDLPSPRSVEHGRISLQELYRNLYGVEGT
ncbi:MAG: ABC-2 type transport system ATP-binding protein [Planctomycetota bacterium]|jgi:ABC-2 type transport system ATP-binding protein